MLSDTELWARARQMREEYQHVALPIAAMRMDAMLAVEDRSGYWEWGQICMMLAKLGPGNGSDMTTR